MNHVYYCIYHIDLTQKNMSLSSACAAGLPGPPGGVHVEEIGDTTVKIRWCLGSDHGSPLIQHIVQTRDFYALDPEDWKTASTSEPTRGRQNIF